MNSPGERILVAIPILLIAIGIVFLNDRWKAGRKPSDAPRSARKDPSWMWCLFSMMIGTLLYSSTPRGLPAAQGGRGAEISPRVWVPSVLALIAIVFGGLYAYSWLRVRTCLKLLRRATEGDVDEAIAEARAIIAARGPSEGYLCTLGYLLMMQENWSEADKQFLEAIRLGGRAFPQLGNHGVMLWKMGAIAEAASILEETCALAPSDPASACNYCLVLADLGRFEDARTQLTRAESLVARSRPREVLDQIADCHRRLENLTLGKKDLSGLQEL